MISSQKNDIAWEVQLDREQQNADFNTLDATIDVVAQEEIVETTRFASLADHVEEICILSVDITDHTNWFFNLNQIGLSCEECESLSEKTHNLNLSDRSLTNHEVFKGLPVGQVIRAKQHVVFDRLVNHPGALSVIESSVRDGVF